MDSHMVHWQTYQFRHFNIWFKICWHSVHSCICWSGREYCTAW